MGTIKQLFWGPAHSFAVGAGLSAGSYPWSAWPPATGLAIRIALKKQVMNIQKTILSLLFVLALQPCIGQSTQDTENTTTYPKAKVTYDDFKELVLEVESIRAERLISLDQFLELQQDTNTIVLDTRSSEKYQRKHLKGAINLPFTEFTQVRN